MDRDGNLQHILQWNKNIRDWKWRERWREIKITLNFTVLSTESMLLLLIKQGGGIWGGKFWICFAIGMYPNVSINLLFSSSDFWTVTHYFNSRKPILNCVRKYTNFICLIHSSPAFPAPFIEETVFSPLYILASFVKDKVSIGAWVYLWAFLFHWSIFLFWCWGRLLKVPWTARNSNQSILREINLEYSLEGLMVKLKLQYFGHLMRTHNSLEKLLILRKIEGRRRGCQSLRCLDGIIDTMKMNLDKLRGGDEGQGDLHAAVHGVAKSQTWLGDWTITTIHLQRERQCWFCLF